MTAYEALTAARVLITDPSRWTQGMLARDKHGFACQPDDPAACCWCADGALQMVTGGDKTEAYNEAFAALADVCPEGVISIVCVNDGRGHQAVLELLDTAIRGH